MARLAPARSSLGTENSSTAREAMKSVGFSSRAERMT